MCSAVRLKRTVEILDFAKPKKRKSNLCGDDDSKSSDSDEADLDWVKVYDDTRVGFKTDIQFAEQAYIGVYQLNERQISTVGEY